MSATIPSRRAAGPTRIFDRVRGAGPATLLFTAAALLSAGVLLHWLSALTFWRDEWGMILDRRGSGIDVYLDPAVEHLLAIPIALYKLQIALFGIGSPASYQVVAVVSFLLSAALLFVYARRRVGEWLALAAVLPLLFLGPAWDDLLFPFQVSFFGAVACGLGALLALDRRDGRGDLAATILLALGLLFSDLGIPFVVAAFVEVALGRDRFQRAYVAVIPAALWLAWYAGWGHQAQTFVSLHNFATLPGYLADSAASSLSSLVGLAVPRDDTPLTSLEWGRPLLAVALGLGIWRASRIGLASLSRRIWALLAMGIAFWSLTGLNAAFFGQATSGRYQYMGVVIWVCVGAELLRGVSSRRGALTLVVAVSALAALANFSLLRTNAAGLAGIAESERGGLAALELTRGEVAPGFVLTEENSDVDYLGIVDAASYFSAIDSYGSPAYTPAELADSSERARAAADKVFAAALRIGLAPTAGVAPAQCARADAGTVTTLPRGGAFLRIDNGSLQLRLRRYARDSSPVALGRLDDGARRQLVIAADGSQLPWQLELVGSGAASICALGQ